MNLLLDPNQKKLYYPKKDVFIMKKQEKIQTKTNQKPITEKIISIPKYRYHFQVIEKESKVVLQKKGEEEQETNWVSTQQNNIGKSQTLQKHFEKRLSQDTISFLPHVLDIHLYLLQSLEKLQEQQIVHNNIQEKNILFSKEIEAPILTQMNESLTFEEYQTKEASKEKKPETWDNYQLSLCLLSCLEHLDLDPENPKIQKYKDILKQNIDNMVERETPQMTRDKILQL